MENRFSLPDNTHYFETFENSHLLRYKRNDEAKTKFGEWNMNSKIHFDFKKKAKRLKTKKDHSLISWEVLQSDVNFIEKHNLLPDSNNYISVNNQGSRIYKVHTTNKKRLFPICGDSIIQLSGSKMQSLVDNFFMQSNISNIKHFIDTQESEKENESPNKPALATSSKKGLSDPKEGSQVLIPILQDEKIIANLVNNDKDIQLRISNNQELQKCSQSD